MDRPFKPKYGTVSLVLLQLVVTAVYGIDLVKASSDQTTQSLCQHSQNLGKIKNATPFAKNWTCKISDSICLIKCKLKNILILKQSGLSLRFTVATGSISGKAAGMVIYLTDPPIFVMFYSFSKSE